MVFEKKRLLLLELEEGNEEKRQVVERLVEQIIGIFELIKQLD